MQKVWMKVGLVAVICLGYTAGVRALEVTAEDWNAKMKLIDDLKKSVDELKTDKEVRGASYPVEASAVDTALDSKYGPNASVTTGKGKLQIGLLSQMWYYNIQHDTRGVFDDPAHTGIQDNNSVVSSAGFRVRREELTFKYDLNEQFTSVLMIDPARDNGGYPNIPSTSGNIKRANFVDSNFIAVAKTPGLNSTSQAGFFQNGGFNSTEPRMLQNAYLEWHDCLPHHTLQFGQFKGQQGEEGPRDSSTLDFCERSMVGFQNDSRWQGAMVRGFWWEVTDDMKIAGHNATFLSEKANNRFRYELGVANSVGSYFTPGDNQNRPNNNYSLDVNAAVLVRPLWDKCMGKLELGASYMGGTKGKGIAHDPIVNPTNDLNRGQYYAHKAGAWAKYEFGTETIASGLRFGGEWGEFRDRENPNSVLDTQGTGGSAGTDFSQNIGQPFTRQGFYFMGGYNIGKSKIGCLPEWAKPFEFVARYEQFQNIETADVADPRYTDVMYTKVETIGINYYAVAHNAKVQANYNFVETPGNHQSNSVRAFHSVHDNSFVFNFQVNF